MHTSLFQCARDAGGFTSSSTCYVAVPGAEARLSHLLMQRCEVVLTAVGQYSQNEHSSPDHVWRRGASSSPGTEKTAKLRSERLLFPPGSQGSILAKGTNLAASRCFWGVRFPAAAVTRSPPSSPVSPPAPRRSSSARFYRTAGGGGGMTSPRHTLLAPYLLVPPRSSGRLKRLLQQVSCCVLQHFDCTVVINL